MDITGFDVLSDFADFGLPPLSREELGGLLYVAEYDWVKTLVNA